MKKKLKMQKAKNRANSSDNYRDLTFLNYKDGDLICVDEIDDVEKGWLLKSEEDGICLGLLAKQQRSVEGVELLKI